MYAGLGGGAAMIVGGGPFPGGGVAPVRLAPHAWQVVVPIGLTSPQRRHLYGVLKSLTPLALTWVVSEQVYTLDGSSVGRQIIWRLCRWHRISLFLARSVAAFRLFWYW